MAFRARTKGGGGFTAKAKRKHLTGNTVSTVMSAQKSRLKRPFAPNRATPATLKEASKSEDPGPNLMDLLCLHFKDKGYKVKIASHQSTRTACLQLQINLTDTLPFAAFPGEVMLGFHLYNNHIWYTAPNWPGYNGKSSHSMGTPEDPELIGRMEGTIDVFISGAKSFSKLVRSALS